MGKPQLFFLQNGGNVVYANKYEYADNFGKKIGVKNLREELEYFRVKHPSIGKPG